MKTVVSVLLMLVSLTARAERNEPNWQDWSNATLDAARQQDKPIFLYLEAVWCHWCHVMQQTTLRDKNVLRVLDENFVAIRIDHDANPSIADRYRDWGWPALIFLTSDRQEIMLRSGYRAPEKFVEILKQIAANPEPEDGRENHTESPTAQGPARLPQALADELLRRHLEWHDAKRGGLRTAQKYMDRLHVELAMELAAQGDQTAGLRARQTLDAARQLIDPVWGGVYQYSTGGRWDRPHYEKLLRIQAAYLEVYSLAAAQWPEDGYAEAGAQILRYVREHLQSPAGMFYNSQDADQVPGQKAHDFFALGAEGRARLSPPRVDQSIYVQGNAEMVPALLRWSAISDDEKAREEALHLGRWLLAQQREGLFWRDRYSHLADQLAALRAWVALYEHTAQPVWLQQATSLADRIAADFAAKDVGLNPLPESQGLLDPRPHLEDNILAARVFNRLAHYTGQASHASAAEWAMRHLARRTVALRRIEESGILLAAYEASRDPLHLTVLGPTDAAEAAQMFARALQTPGWYRRIEWVAQAADLPNPDIPYPQFDRPAGFVCTSSRCSRPSFDVADYDHLILTLSRP